VLLFSQTKALHVSAQLSHRNCSFLPGLSRMQWLTTDWLGPNNQAAENVCQRTCGGLCLGERRTADPSASLGITKGRAVTFNWEPLDRDGQKETLGQIRLKLDDLGRKINKVTDSQDDDSVAIRAEPAGHLTQWPTRISCTRLHPSLRVRLSVRLVNATKVHRKFGGWLSFGSSERRGAILAELHVSGERAAREHTREDIGYSLLSGH
jgi:hypothetical protein